MAATLRGLDLFSGAGGCTRGYLNAARNLGIRLQMTGVDRRWMKNYVWSGGFRFIEADAMEVLRDKDFVTSFDFVHLSPPCQYWSPTRTIGNQNLAGKEDLLTPVLEIAGMYESQPWIIENVEAAPLDPALMLCGSMFGLTGIDTRRQLRRHRKFWTQGFTPPVQPDCQHNQYRALGVYGPLNNNLPGGGEIARDLNEGRKLMGIDWMTWRELREAIPPAYTEYIGEALLKEVA